MGERGGVPGWPSIWRTTYYAGTMLPDDVAEQVAAQTWEHYTPHMLNVCGNTTVHNAARAAAELGYEAGLAAALNATGALREAVHQLTEYAKSPNAHAAPKVALMHLAPLVPAPPVSTEDGG